ncbi:hypothetical protein SLA2020_454130 [Shorea laevis]
MNFKKPHNTCKKHNNNRANTEIGCIEIVAEKLYHNKTHQQQDLSISIAQKRKLTMENQTKSTGEGNVSASGDQNNVEKGVVRTTHAKRRGTLAEVEEASKDSEMVRVH